MNKLNRVSKILLFVSCLSGALWLGSYTARLFITYRLFENTELILKSYYTSSNLSEVLLTLLPAFTSTLILYIVFILLFVSFLISSGISLKKNGWLFMITVLILVTAPFEVYLMTIDFNIISQVNSESFNPEDIINLIIKRFKVFGSFPVIEIFCYFAIVFLLIFKPLTKETLPVNEN